MKAIIKQYDEMTNEELQSIISKLRENALHVNVDTAITIYVEIEKATNEQISRISNFQDAIDAFNDNLLTITQLEEYRD